MNEALKKLQIPAIGLIITGVLNGFTGAFVLLSGLHRLLIVYGFISKTKGYIEELPVSESEKLGYYFSTFSVYGIALLCLILAPVILYGALKMLKGQKLRLAKTAAILSIIPLTSCCFPLGLIFGIWALVVLNNSDVKAVFNGDFVNQNNFPPPPPQNF